ncbi:MAG: OmpP1/FadL family transporter [Pseudomonadota bacterium]
MANHLVSNKGLLGLSIAASALLACGGQALAGGFALREQSASSQGASFAGSAAGYDLSSMYWNPAAVAVKSGPGFNSESHYAVIMPRAEVEVETFAGLPGFLVGNPSSGDIASPAIVGASYWSYQLNEQTFVGLSVNSPFGLVTEPQSATYLGSVLGRTTRLLTFNAAPTLGYKIAPGVIIGAGAQLQYGDGELKFATGLPTGPTTGFEGDGFAFGGTAGILLQPAAGTSIGLGYRSQLTQNLDGTFYTIGLPGGASLQTDAEVDIELPDIVTLSMRQSIAPNMRLLGTVEWSHWSRFEELRVVSKGIGPTVLGLALPGATIATIPANWEDGWFFSLGGEYDLPSLGTLRAGIAYEISPVDSPDKRFVAIPDNDRIWLSLGATVQITPSMTADLAYTHIFIEDGDFTRTTLAGIPLTGNVEASTDILAVSLKTKW